MFFFLEGKVIYPFLSVITRMVKVQVQLSGAACVDLRLL